MSELTQAAYESDTHRLPICGLDRWFVFTRDYDEPECFEYEADARERARECNQLYPRIAPFLVLRMREVA